MCISMLNASDCQTVQLTDQITALRALICFSARIGVGRLDVAGLSRAGEGPMQVTLGARHALPSLVGDVFVLVAESVPTWALLLQGRAEN